VQELAIIGPTASGKSKLAIKKAQQIDAYILSVDSLSVYKDIDIISAKPSLEDLKKVKHFGINVVYANEHFNAGNFIKIYEDTRKICQKDNKNLVIVGGSSFYLKALLDGLFDEPQYSKESIAKTNNLLKNLSSAHQFLQTIDKELAQKIAPNDKYRIQKALLLYFHTNQKPSLYRQAHQQKKQKHIKILKLNPPKEELRQRIYLRTQKMIKNGAIDEVASLEHKYGRNQKPFNSIGIREIFEFLDGRIKSKDELIEKISLHTIQLAKRQRVFNKTQF